MLKHLVVLDVERVHIGDESLQAQGDSYFVTETKPEAPDLLAVPAPPDPPEDPQPLRMTNLKIDVLFDSVAFNTNVNLSLKRGNQLIESKPCRLSTRHQNEFVFATQDVIRFHP